MRYRLRICRPCDIAALRGRTISCTNARLTRALLADTNQIHSNSYTHAHRPTHRLFNKQCRTPIIISKDDIMPPEKPWIDSQLVTGCHCVVQHNQIILQHELQFHVTTVALDAALFYLYFAPLNILSVLCAVRNYSLTHSLCLGCSLRSVSCQWPSCCRWQSAMAGSASRPSHCVWSVKLRYVNGPDRPGREEGIVH